MIERLTAISIQSSSYITTFVQSTKNGGDSYKSDMLAAVGSSGGGVYTEFLLQMVADQGDALSMANELLKRAEKHGESLEFASAIYDTIMTPKGRLTYVEGAKIMKCDYRTYKNKYSLPVNREADSIMSKVVGVIFKINDRLK